MSYNRKVCVVLLIGVPGSGKSFFRTFLERFFKENANSVLGLVRLCSVCYDDFASVKNPSQNCDWKNERLGLLKVVENTIKYFKEDVHVEDFSSKFSGISIVNKDVVKPSSTLIVVDDNMYYRSMRYEYYKLAKSLGVSFSQIFFDIKLEEALKCNRKRIDAQVPDSVIETMYFKIERPLLSHSWEIYSVSVLSYKNFENDTILGDIFSCIKKSLENPVLLEKRQSLDSEKSKQITSSNALHQIDNVLKQLVKFHIEKAIKKGKHSELSLISKNLSEKRLDIFSKIKKGVIDLKLDLNKPIITDDLDYIKPVLSELLLDNHNIP